MRLVRRTPITAGPIVSATRMTVSEKSSLSPRRGGADTNLLLAPNMCANVGGLRPLRQCAAFASPRHGLHADDGFAARTAHVSPAHLAAQFLPRRCRPGVAV